MIKNNMKSGVGRRASGIGAAALFLLASQFNGLRAVENKTINLPAPRLDSDFSVEKAMLQRRSVRSYSDEPLTLEQLAQLLWSCQGTTDSGGYRTAPSAGALYPLEVYAVVSRVSGLEDGIYHYLPGAGVGRHSIELLKGGDRAGELAGAALDQTCIRRAALNIVIAAVFERTAVKYGRRAERYVFMEAGHAAQNVCLQAQALGLGVVTIGAFQDEEVKKLLEVRPDPVYILCVGRPRR